jgi:hypothetical protein
LKKLLLMMEPSHIVADMRFDVERKQIVHLPEIATARGYVGSRQVRPYQFEGQRLIFSDIEKQEADVESWKIVREKAH